MEGRGSLLRRQLKILYTGLFLGHSTFCLGQGYSDDLVKGDVVLPPNPVANGPTAPQGALWQVGPTVGFQVPHLWDVALEFRLFGVLGFGIGGGTFPKQKSPVH